MEPDRKRSIRLGEIVADGVITVSAAGTTFNPGHQNLSLVSLNPGQLAIDCPGQ
jgi:hypothetical protein